MGLAAAAEHLPSLPPPVAEEVLARLALLLHPRAHGWPLPATCYLLVRVLAVLGSVPQMRGAAAAAALLGDVAAALAPQVGEETLPTLLRMAAALRRAADRLALRVPALDGLERALEAADDGAEPAAGGEEGDRGTQGTQAPLGRSITEMGRRLFTA